MLRYGLSQYIDYEAGDWPVATLLANMISCLILGFLIGYQLKNELSSSLSLLLATGLCGGFSTFSTFSAEIFTNLQSGQHLLAFIYLAVSLAAGLACMMLGYWIITCR